MAAIRTIWSENRIFQDTNLMLKVESGRLETMVGTWAVNKKLSEQNPERQAILEEAHEIIHTLAEEGPRPSFVGRLIEPAVTHVLLWQP